MRSGRSGFRGWGKHNISCQKADKTGPALCHQTHAISPAHHSLPYLIFGNFIHQPFLPEAEFSYISFWRGRGGQRHYLGRGSDVRGGGREGRWKGGGRHHHHRHPLLPTYLYLSPDPPRLSHHHILYISTYAARPACWNRLTLAKLSAAIVYRCHSIPYWLTWRRRRRSGGKERDHFYHFSLAFHLPYLIQASVAFPMSTGG